MATRPTKGDHGHPDAGSRGRGPQKATFGSAVSPEVAEEQAAAATHRGSPSEPGIGDARPEPEPDDGSEGR
jgi:hypothetical protein